MKEDDNEVVISDISSLKQYRISLLYFHHCFVTGRI